MIVSGGVKYHDDLEDLLTPIEAVRPHPDNPNNGDEAAIEESIEVNGMYRPIQAQRSTGHILAGNTTYAACLGLGAEQIPVVWLDVDDQTALRILLADNQLAKLARMDQGLLDTSLKLLLETDLKLLGTGYRYPEEWEPPAEPTMPNPNHTVIVTLRGDELDAWFDIPATTDADRLAWLLENARR